MSEGTSLLIGQLACKIAGVSEIYAKNIEIITQRVNFDGKLVPFNFLLVHGEGMPYQITNTLKASLERACKQNVDAIIFGHTHKMGSASLTMVSKNTHGDWIEKRVTSFNAGTVQETADYADKVGYPANKPFDGTVMHCSVAFDDEGNMKKCIDFENIMNVVSKKDRDMLKSLNNKLSVLEAKKYESKDQIVESYSKLIEQYSKKGFNFQEKDNGNYFVSISGTSDLYSSKNSKKVSDKIRSDLKYMVSIAKDIKNLSVVLNGDLIYDNNDGYIAKKDYCADTLADIQDLCEILKPIADKIVAFNNGKMEEGIMTVERDKSNGRIGVNGKNKLKELANYASQVLQLDEKDAYEPYDKNEFRNKQLAIQNDMVNEANQIELDRAYADYVKKQTKGMTKEEAEQYLFDLNLDLDAERKIKDNLVKELRAKHKILDISDSEDKRIIDRLYPLSKIDLRMPNQNLIGNIFMKLLGIQSNKVKLSATVNAPSIFKVKDKNGKSKTVYSYYCTSLTKFMKDLPTKLQATTEPPDVVLLNNYVTKTGSDLQEFTTQIRLSYVDKNGRKKNKDVMIINGGSFAYSKYLSNARIPTNMFYKVVDVEPIFNTLVPKDSVNYAKDTKEHPVIEKYNYESVLNKNSSTERIISLGISRSAQITLNKFDEKIAKQNNSEIAENLIKNLSQNNSENQMWGVIWNME